MRPPRGPVLLLPPARRGGPVRIFALPIHGWVALTLLGSAFALGILAGLLMGG